MSLEITSAQKLVDGEEGPEFVGPASAIVSGAVASFDPAPEVKWDKDLKTSGETAMVEAVLRIGTRELVSCYCLWKRSRSGSVLPIIPRGTIMNG